MYADYELLFLHDWINVCISYRYIFKNEKKVGIQELGPRFTLKLRSLQKGTFDSKFGEYEWVHKVRSKSKISFMRNIGCLNVLLFVCNLGVSYTWLTAPFNVSAPWDGLQQKKIPSLRDRLKTQTIMLTFNDYLKISYIMERCCRTTCFVFTVLHFLHKHLFIRTL